MVNEEFPGSVFVCTWCLRVHAWGGGAPAHVGVDGGLGWTVECLPSRFSALFLNFLRALVAIGHAPTLCLSVPPVLTPVYAADPSFNVCVGDPNRLESLCLSVVLSPSPSEMLSYPLFPFILCGPEERGSGLGMSLNPTLESDFRGINP